MTAQASDVVDANANGSEPAAASSLVTRASDVRSRSIRWAWTGRMAIGYLTVQTGIEGIGKSVFDAWMIARWTRGGLPGEWRGTPVNVLVVASEDGIADTWKPRLDLAEADTERVGFLNIDDLEPDWNIRDGIDPLTAAMRELDAGVVFLDALLDHMPCPRGGESINSPTFVRGALAPLKRTVRELDVVGLYSMHPPKGPRANFRDLVQASQAFAAVPRVGLLFAWHPDDAPNEVDSRRVLIRGKGNLGRDPGALEFRVSEREYQHDDGRATGREVVTDVEPSSVTLADLDPMRATTERQPSKIERAADVIRDALDDGWWHDAKPIRERLAEQGLDHNQTVTEATRRLRVAKRKQPGITNGPWEWSLPAAGANQSEESKRALTLRPARATLQPPLDSSPQSSPIPCNNGKSPRVTDSEPTGHHGIEESRVNASRARELLDRPDGVHERYAAELLGLDLDQTRELLRDAHGHPTGDGSRWTRNDAVTVTVTPHRCPPGEAR
jgi:hypothetical protein